MFQKSKQRIIFGLDESGRGSLAGPVVAAAVVGPIRLGNKKQIRDSKKLSSVQRERIYQLLKSCSDVEWGIGRVSERVIDRINILEATKRAMKRAVENLKNKIQKKPDLLLLDGNFRINLKVPQKPIVRGDETLQIISAASIIAKVTRDRIMLLQHKKYPQYGFDRHKGYGTKMHLQRIKSHGPCPIHRRTFKPMIGFLKN